MRIIFLNTWNGELEKAMRSFVKEQSPTTDIFCLQEVFDAARPMFEELLPDFHRALAYKKMGIEGELSQATYVKKHLQVRSVATLLEDVPNAGFGLYTEVARREGSVHICNFHGVAYAIDDKLDNPERLQQSRAVIDFFHSLRGPKIVGGDFNVSPDTESVRVFSRNGYVDLVKKFAIETTRNRFAWERYPHHEMLYSDYVFASPDINVKNFVVPRNEISDHLPLILDIAD